MKEAVFLLLGTPLVWICAVTLFQMIMVHVPYLGANCGSLSCAAGSLESFAVWTLFSVLVVGALLAWVWGSAFRAGSIQQMSAPPAGTGWRPGSEHPMPHRPMPPSPAGPPPSGRQHP